MLAALRAPRSVAVPLAVALGLAVAAGCDGTGPVAGVEQPAASSRASGASVPTGSGASVTVATARCDWAWPAPGVGAQRFDLRNEGDQPTRAVLVDAGTGAIYAQVTTLAPGTSRLVRVTLPAGTYRWRCVPLDGSATASAPRTLAAPYRPAPGPPLRSTRSARRRSTTPVTSYRADVSSRLTELAAATSGLRASAASGDLARARSSWSQAHLAYERLGAAYGTFGDLADRIDGMPAGLPHGVDDPAFSGFLRVERDLWSPTVVRAPLRTSTRALDDAVRALVAQFPRQVTDPADLPLRAHEILENTAQRELTGRSDEGSHTGLATARANVEGTRMVLRALAVPLQRRDPSLLRTVTGGLAELADQLDRLRRSDGSWPAVDALTPAQRQRLDARTGDLLEHLALAPDILPMPRSTAPT